MRRPRLHFRIGAGGVLLLAALCFILTLDELVALLLACAVHEAGHIAAIRLTGGRVMELTIGAAGAVIERSESRSRLAEAVCAASGPAAGAIYALAASALGRALGSDMLATSAGMSLVLSAFNSLPVLPLDGGRVLECVTGRRAAAVCSLAAASLVLLTGIILAASDYGIALLIAGAVLMVQQAGV